MVSAACGRAEHWRGCFLRVFLRVSSSLGKKRRSPLKQKLTAIDRSRKSRCRTKSARPLRDVRFRTSSLDAASEKFRGQPAFNQKENSKAGCPPIASYCTTWFTTGDALFAEKVSPKY